MKDEEVRFGTERLGYEVRMLVWTAEELHRRRGISDAPVNDNDKWLRNALIHSFLLAVRNLYEFLWHRESDVSRRDGRGDMLPRHFVKETTAARKTAAPTFHAPKHWRLIAPERPVDEGTGFIRMVHQRLAHLTWAGVHESKIDWDEPAIACEFAEPLLVFRSEIDPQLRSPYFDQAVDRLQRFAKRFETERAAHGRNLPAVQER